MATKVCFIGGARYSDPLDMTSEKKFRVIRALGTLFVIGFSRDLRMRRFTEHARFYLLPQVPWPIVRYLEMFVFGQMILVWLIVWQRIDVVVAQSPYEGFVAALATKFTGRFGYQARLVVEIHGDFERSLFLQREVGLTEVYRFVMRWVAHYSIRQADLLRAISKSTKDQIKCWAPEKMVVQFPAWTDIETFLRSPSETKNVQGILYVGVLTPLKGVHHLLNAFALLAKEWRSAQLSIIGKDENKTYAADLSEQVKKLELKDRVRFMAAMPQEELAFWMANSSVLVLPSSSEGLGRVVIEAMATGTPVIGSRVGGIPELIEDGVSGFLIPPGDELALAERIRWILTHPDLAAAMGARGRAFVLRFFSTESYLNGYKQIVAAVSQPCDGQKAHATSTV